MSRKHAGLAVGLLYSSATSIVIFKIFEGSMRAALFTPSSDNFKGFNVADDTVHINF
jgi:hypothetical protein